MRSLLLEFDSRVRSSRPQCGEKAVLVLFAEIVFERRRHACVKPAVGIADIGNKGLRKKAEVFDQRLFPGVCELVKIVLLPLFAQLAKISVPVEYPEPVACRDGIFVPGAT